MHEVIEENAVRSCEAEFQEAFEAFESLEKARGLEEEYRALERLSHAFCEDPTFQAMADAMKLIAFIAHTEKRNIDTAATDSLQKVAKLKEDMYRAKKEYESKLEKSMKSKKENLDLQESLQQSEAAYKRIQSDFEKMAQESLDCAKVKLVSHIRRHA
jgi:hypothetical protein